MRIPEIALSERVASLRPFFTPNGVAVIGASRDASKLGHAVLRNLVGNDAGYPGPVYPVNPRAKEIFGFRCYSDIQEVPDPVELALLVIPASQVLSAIEACGKRGVKALVVLSGGFRETGRSGAILEDQVVASTRRYGMRLMGPNGIGVIDTHTPLNTTFARGMPARGNIAFISQSGALCGGIIDWIIGRGIGISRFLSIGNEADVNETDAIQYLGNDEVSQVIGMYLEDIKGGPGFVEAVRQTARRKPVLAIKTGRTPGGQIATTSHTGALVNAHSAFSAACRKAGVIEVKSVRSLFTGALALAFQPLPQGNRVAIVTNAGGPAALAADALEELGLKLARTSPDIQKRLSQFLPGNASLGGPVDMLGSANQDDYRQTLEVMFNDPQNDAILAIMVPPALIDSLAVVEAMATAIQASRKTKPLVACLMGEASLESANRAALSHEIPAYTFPEECAEALSILWQRSNWLSGEKAAGIPTQAAGINLARQRAGIIIHQAQQSGEMAMGVMASQAILEAYSIPTPAAHLATSCDQAVAYARQIGYPVVLKLVSPEVLHKSDLGGVILNVSDDIAVEKGYNEIIERVASTRAARRVSGVLVQKMVEGGHEVIVGFKRDPTFGGLVMFGLGGIYVEALSDVSFRLAPLNRSEADAMIREVRSARLLDGLRGASPSDRAALLDAIVSVGQLATDWPQISELDINPLLALPQGQGVLAVDIRMIIAPVQET